MPFYLARGAKESGIDVGIVLALDATVLVKPELRKYVQPWDSRLSMSSSSSRSTTGSPSTFAGAEPRYAQLLLEYDRAVSF